MAEIVIQKLKRNGWPEDEAMTMIDESLLEYTEGVFEDDNERSPWQEWRLDGKIVKRGAQVNLKKGLEALAQAASFGK